MKLVKRFHKTSPSSINNNEVSLIRSKDKESKEGSYFKLTENEDVLKIRKKMWEEYKDT